MHALYDIDAPKKPTNLSINSDLLKKAKGLNINLSATLEAALSQHLNAQQAQQWQQENQQAIAAYNKHADENGVFSDGLRSF